MSRKKIELITCDGYNCKKTKDKDVNHWIVGAATDNIVLLATSVEYIPELRDDQYYEETDFCGSECAMKWASKMLEGIRK